MTRIGPLVCALALVSTWGEAAEEAGKATSADSKKASEKADAARGASTAAEKFLTEGRELMKKKDYKAAAAHFDACIKADPKLADCYRLRGTASGHLQEKDNVLKYYNLYLEHAAPDDPMAPKVRDILSSYQKAIEEANRP